VFRGSSLDAIIDESLSCCGKYTLRNTQHHSVAGITSDGCTIFAVNCQIGGRCCTAMGAFDRFGKPIPLTMPQQNLLGKYIPNTQNAMIPDAKSPTVIGLKSSSGNPTFGVYVDAPNKQFIFHVNGSLDDPDLKTHASMTLNKDGKIVGSAVDATFTKGGFQAAGSSKFNDRFKVTESSLQLSATNGRWSAGAGVTRSGTETVRQAEISYQNPKLYKVTVSLRPDEKTPTTPSRPDFSKPPSFEDHSTFRIKIEINLP
jgi:hypothetical protein